MPQLSYQEAAALDSRGSSHHQTQEGESDCGGLKLSLGKEENYESHENHGDYHSGSTEWMSSKKRLILKMMKPNPYRPERDQTPTNAQLIKSEDQKNIQAANSSSSESTKHGSNNPVKVCSDCNTTKTPLWRSGPRGPKSLCNACGIRRRKARRAMAAAATANGTILEAESSPTKADVQLKDKRPTNGGYSRKHKKRSKISATTSQGKRKKTCFEEFLISLRNNLAFHRVFPQDEKEAAILLMALSYGLFHG